MESLESEEPSSYSTNLSDEEKWQCGTNVRAPFADDGELYEAIIERIFDDYAIVRYLGYENEEAIELKDLRPSLGEESIAEQIKFVTECDGEEEEDGIEIEPEINQWKIGMRCRALYEPNEVVYEAVIQQIDTENCKAVVVMAGYDIPYEVSFESIPELRIKQERNVRAHLASKASAVEEIPTCDISPIRAEQWNEKSEGYFGSHRL
ncbi:SMN protein Smn1 [Sarracenia purpurea var. burkii]